MVMFPDEHLEQVFALLARVAEAIVATVGPACEAVVHDLRNPDHPVVAIAGNLTRREIGSPAPEPAMLPGRVDRFTEDWLCDSTRTLFGKELLASTVWVRDERGHIVGALCINMDFTDLRLARDIIDRHIVEDPRASDSPPPATFATTAREFVAIALQDVLREVGKPLHHLDRDDKIRIVRELDRTGAFTIRGTAEIVAEELGVSRASVYAYLKDARSAPALAGGS
jgi:predicted transcriptional regulator YheO